MNLIQFNTRDELNTAMCEKLIEVIEHAIDTYGDCRILLSGGSTPASIYTMLGTANLPWLKVIIGLVDDRYVPSSSQFSNAKLINDTIIKNATPGPTFLPMVVQPDKILNMKKVDKLYKLFEERTDLCFLGMGTDGHTASLFPGDTASENDLQGKNTSKLLYTNAPVEPTERITISTKLIERSRSIVVLITGKEKLDVLNVAQVKKLPIGYILNSCMDKTTVYHTNE